MLILHTSGSTGPAKRVAHKWEFIRECALKTIKEQGLSSHDRVIDVFPHNTIAHWTLSALPAFLSGAEYHSMKFEAASFIAKFKDIKPTILNLVPRHLELLQEIEEFKELDMSCVRYMTLGAAPVTQTMINEFTKRGVMCVAVTYGMTEAPPPKMIGYNQTNFTIIDDDITFDEHGEAIINGKATGDIFHGHESGDGSLVFSHRLLAVKGNTWKDVR